MDIRDRKRIQKNYDGLVADMSVALDDIMDLFITKEIINIQIKTSINQSGITKKAKCRAFLDLFLKKDKLLNESIAFEVLCTALDNAKCSHMKQELLDTEVHVDDLCEEEDKDWTGEEDGQDSEASGPSNQTTVITITNSTGFHIGNKTETHIHHHN